MKLSRKLPLAIAGALFLAAGAGLFGIYKLNQATRGYARVIEVDYTNEDTASTILTNFKQQVQEWKDTLLRGKDPAALAKYWGNFEKQERAVADDARKLTGALPDGEARTLVTQFAEAHAKMGVAYRKGLEAFKAANFEPTVGDVAVKGIDRAPTDLLRLAREKIVAGTKASVAEAGRTSSAATMGSLILMLIVVLLGSVGGLIVSRQVIRQLGGDPAEARQVARRVAAGELDFSIAVATGHEKSLLAALEVMVRQLTSVVQGIHQSSDSVDVASREIAAGNRNLSSRTEQQAASVEETASAMEELTSTVKETAANAEEANRLASSASRVAERGLRAVNSAVTTIQEIAASSKQIEDIIQVIDSIAFQTNILALNAAVEAARAGNSGRGFAVVASEVRNLAQRSAGAAREIKGLITASTAKAGQGASLATEAGKEVQAIVQEVKRLSTTISEISSAAHEQAAGIEQVNKAIVQLDEVTQQNAALVEEATAAASSLQEQAKNMVRAVGAFKLPGAPSHRPQTKQRVAADVEEAAADPAADSPAAERAGLTRAA